MPISRLMAILAVAAALAAGIGAGQFETAAADPQGPPQPAVGQKPAAQGAPRMDFYGDPLPDGAVARLGSARFRHAGLSDYVLLPDGRTALTVGGDTMLRFWDLDSGRPTRVVQLQGNPGSGIHYTLSPDGKTLMAGVGKQLVFWVVDSGKKIKAIPAPEEGACLRFSPDGKKLAVGRRGRLSLLDWETGTERDFPPPSHPRPKLSSADSTFYGRFSPDGKCFVAGAGSDDALGVFDVAAGREVRRLDVFALAFRVSPNSKQLAVVSSNNDNGEEQRVIRVFDLASGKQVAKHPFATADNHFFLGFSPDGKTLACGFAGQTSLLDLATGRVLRRLSGPYAPTFSRDGKKLIASTGQRLRMWDVASGKEFNDRSGDFGYRVPAVSPDGRRLASNDWTENVVNVWDTADGRLLHRLPLKGERPYVRSLGFSGDGRTVFAGQDRGLLQWWDVATGREQRTLQLQELRDLESYAHLRVSADGKRVSSLDRFFTDNDATTRLANWDAGTGKSLAGHLLPTNTEHVAWLADGKSAVIPLDDGLAMLDVSNGATRLRLAGLEGKKDANCPLVVSPDGRLLAGRQEVSNNKHEEGTLVEYDAGTIVVWETATGKAVASVAIDGAGQMALTPDNRSVITTEDGVLCVRDLATGKVRHRWTLPDGVIGSHVVNPWVLAMLLSPDGQRAFTVVADGTALVWDLTPGLRRGEPPVKEPSAKQLAARWADLAGEDAAKAQRAVWALADAPKQAVPFLGGRLKPIAPPDEKRVRRWIADLDSDDFSTRQAAQVELARLGELVEPIVEETLKGNRPLETRRRLEQLLEKTHGLSPPEQLRVLRAVQALELIGTSEARTILNALTKGAAGARLTREAHESLERLNKRAVVYTGR